MKELTKCDLNQVNGGNVPMAYFYDDATIKENGENVVFWGTIYAKVLFAYFKEILG